MPNTGIRDILFNSRDINTQFGIGNSDYRGGLIHYAANVCQKEVILTLIRQGADIMLEDSLHQLPLQVAIYHNNSKFNIFEEDILRHTNSRHLP
jgi:ankyrin repeat protein